MELTVQNDLVIGLMSGSSLDGLDLAACRFVQDSQGNWTYRIEVAETLSYAPEWRQKLSDAILLNESDLQTLDQEYGQWLGQAVKIFCDQNSLKPGLISSHGHTVRHQPEQGISIQIGSGDEIRKNCGIPVVCNFRYQDVLLGGQGAPLVPIGDELLFSRFGYCLNLGGFSNVSWRNQGRRQACDLSPCNILLNRLAAERGLEYDEEGELARSGVLIQSLYDKWNSFPFFGMEAPKSLGREWFESHYLADADDPQWDTADKLRTATEHIAFQMASFINSHRVGKNDEILVTGGGAHNRFLMERFAALLEPGLVPLIPDALLVSFKEALIFAFLGWLKIRGEVNVLATVTGASHDHSAGDLYP